MSRLSLIFVHVEPRRDRRVTDPTTPQRVLALLAGSLLMLALSACGQSHHAAAAGATAPASSLPSSPDATTPTQAATAPNGSGPSSPTRKPTTGSTTAQPAQGTGRILATPCLDLRSGPSTTSSSVACVPTNTVVTISCVASGTSVSGPYGESSLWDHTTYSGKSGYVPDAQVYTGSGNAVANACTTTDTTPNGRVNKSSCLDMRTGPSSSAAVVQCLPYNLQIVIDCTATGTSVTGPYGPSTLWDHTAYQGKSGYLPDAWVYTGQAGAVAGNC